MMNHGIMEELLIPKCTIEQQFMFMLHERIISLEKLNQNLEKKIASQETEITILRNNQLPIRYSIHHNNFNASAILQWDIRKPIHEAEIYYKDCGRKFQISQPFLDAYVCLESESYEVEEFITFLVPTERGSFGSHRLPMLKLNELNVRKFLQSIYDFYTSSSLK